MEEPPHPEPVKNPRRRSKKSVTLRTRRRALRHREEARTMTPEEPPPLKQLMKYAVPTVLALLMLRHQRQPDALFRENPAPLWSFTTATAVYWLIAGEMRRSRKRKWVFKIMRRGALVFGVQSALSLLFMFLPPRPLPFPLLPLLVSLLIALCFAHTWILTHVMNMIDKIRSSMAVRNRGIDSTNQPHVLPLSHK